jgi:hypothetical protein
LEKNYSYDAVGFGHRLFATDDIPFGVDFSLYGSIFTNKPKENNLATKMFGGLIKAFFFEFGFRYKF